MKFYDLEFADGKRCRMIDPDGDGLAPTNFQPGYMVSMTRIIGDPPAKLPWKRVANDRWKLHNFTLRKDGKLWRLSWPGGGVYGDKDHVSAAVRENWAAGA